jgi:hypothetical protein
MDKSTCEVFHARLDSMLSGLLAEFNNEMSRSRITYSDTGLKITIETVEKNADGSLKIDDFANAKIHDALWCYYRDVPKVVIGLKWRDEKGNTWRILDWNNRARTYPIVCKNQNGESSRWAVAYVASRLQVALVA